MDVSGPSCRSCNKSFTQKRYLAAHSLRCLAKQSRKKITYKCCSCDKEFSSPAHLKRHVDTHSDVRAFECNICDQLFAQKPHLDRHYAVHHGSSEKKFVCHRDYCNASFPTTWELKRHTLRIHGSGKSSVCTLCRKEFSRACDLKKHLETHKGLRPYSCRNCSKAFARSWDLDTHVAIHRTSRCNFECIECEERFLQRIQFERHWTKEHRDLFRLNMRGTLLCPECPDDSDSVQTWDSADDLVHHLLIVHQRKKVYRCMFCDNVSTSCKARADHVCQYHIRRINSIAEEKDDLPSDNSIEDGVLVDQNLPSSSDEEVAPILSRDKNFNNISSSGKGELSTRQTELELRFSFEKSFVSQSTVSVSKFLPNALRDVFPCLREFVISSPEASGPFLAGQKLVLKLTLPYKECDETLLRKFNGVLNVVVS